MYTIKELAEKAGVIPNAIRFYEKKGLLHPKRTESNYRMFDVEDVARLEQILLYRKMGFSIEDIKEFTGLTFYKNYDLVLGKTASLVSGDVVAEIGIGTGNLAVQILKNANLRGRVIEYIGIDQSINMLKEAKKKCPGISLKKGDFLNLPLEAKCCDTVVSSYSFHHCNAEEKKLAIEEMHRVLKEKGTIVIADLMFKNIQARKDFEAICSKAEQEDLEDEYFANVDDVSEIFTALGYECNAEQVDELIWIIRAKKNKLVRF